MSQKSYIADVITWDIQQCQSNLHEALPRLINYIIEREEDITEVFQILVQSFLPLISVDCLESQLFSPISDKIAESFEQLLKKIKQCIADATNHVTHLQQQLVAMLQSGVQILSSLEECVTYLVTTDGCTMNQIQSLPKTIIRVVHASYIHCKESTNVFGNLLAALSEQLSALFKKAHLLQTAFITLLDKIDLKRGASDNDLEVMCLVLHGFFDIGQVASSLDVKIMITMWKTISRLACQYKDLLCTRLDLDLMLSTLSDDMVSSYLYLLQIVPTTEETGSAEEKVFLKNVKILGFQMKVLVMLVKEFEGYLGGCIPQIYKLILILQRSCYDNPWTDAVVKKYADELEKHVSNAVVLLITSLVPNKAFTQCLTAVDQDLDQDLRLPWCLTLVNVLDHLPRHQDEIQAFWIEPTQYPEDRPRLPLLTALFHAIDLCYVEVSLPVVLPGVMCQGNPIRDVSLYEYICCRLCAAVATQPQKRFKALEECLLENVLSRSVLRALLAIDVWCFLARYGTAELCRDHVFFLTRLWNTSSTTLTPECCHLLILIKRMVTFLAPEQQEEYVKTFLNEDHLTLWGYLPLHIFHWAALQHSLDSLLTWSLSRVQSWISGGSATPQMAVQLVSGLRCLCNLHKDTAVVESDVMRSKQDMVVNTTIALWDTLTAVAVRQHPSLQCVVCQLLRLHSLLLPVLHNTQLFLILTLISELDVGDWDADIQLSLLEFLTAMGDKALPPSSEQAALLRLLPAIFTSLLSSTNPVIHQEALHAFSRFAESTVHESVVGESLQTDSRVQDDVVFYLNVIANGTPEGDTDVVCIKAQNEVVGAYLKSSDGDLYEPACCPHTPSDTQNPAKRFKSSKNSSEEEALFASAMQRLQEGLECLESIENRGPCFLQQLTRIHQQLGAIINKPS